MTRMIRQWRTTTDIATTRVMARRRVTGTGNIGEGWLGSGVYILV